MKTNLKSHRGNNTQKTVFKSLAVLASFVLISLTVSAQEFWHLVIENETTKELALAIIDNRDESKSTNSKDSHSMAFYPETESESKMEVEDWMTNNNLFHVPENPEKRKVIKTSTFLFVEAEDPKLKFERWMFDPNCWKVRR